MSNRLCLLIFRSTNFGTSAEECGDTSTRSKNKASKSLDQQLGWLDGGCLDRMPKPVDVLVVQIVDA